MQIIVTHDKKHQPVHLQLLILDQESKIFVVSIRLMLYLLFYDCPNKCDCSLTTLNVTKNIQIQIIVQNSHIFLLLSCEAYVLVFLVSQQPADQIFYSEIWAFQKLCLIDDTADWNRLCASAELINDQHL